MSDYSTSAVLLSFLRAEPRELRGLSTASPEDCRRHQAAHEAMQIAVVVGGSNIFRRSLRCCGGHGSRQSDNMGACHGHRLLALDTFEHNGIGAGS